MKRARIAWLAGAALTVAAFSPSSMAESVLNGQVAMCHIDRLTRDIHWYDSLDQAKETAKAQGKMIFWMHMLGTISGAT
jgi:hypothetical protein